MVIIFIQHFRFKKQYIGFSSLQDAISEESKKLDLLQREFETLVELTKNEEVKAAVAVRNQNEAVAELKNLQDSFAELDTATHSARSVFSEVKVELSSLQADLASSRQVSHELGEIVLNLKQEQNSLETRLAHLVILEQREQTIQAEIEALEIKCQQEINHYEQSKEALRLKLLETEASLISNKDELSKLMGRIDLYSRVDEYTRVGHFEVPNYLYETSVRYQTEIKEIREQQRKLIREKRAVTYPENVLLCTNKSLDKKIIDGQVQLMLNAFNVECDLLIEKVKPGNLDRTLEQIEKKAELLEKNCATLKCGFNIEYVELKFEECKFQFEYSLKKRDEQEEQRVIREQMREEVRVQKQYEEAIRESEKEELKFTRLLEKAREHLLHESEQERSLSLAKIQLLEDQLKEAQERCIRAKSMAEQTRRGYVYVISNIGAFGEGVYKIGLTRRLDPQERVDELSSASVPFPFDVHAMCYSDDAPALEHALHKRFSDRRVNNVNFRKEFFRVDLEEVQSAIEEMVNEDVDFLVTAKAEDYFESKRLMHE